MFKRNLLNAAVIGALGLAAGSAQAVYVGEDGTGEVLIYPYYNVRAGYFTTFSVVNSTTKAKAVKVRVLEGKNSREVIDFNLYLSPNDVWTGAIEMTANGAKLSTTDTSCTVPALSTSQGGAGSVEFRNFEYTGSKADGEDQTLNRTREGYIELIEMGELNTNSIAKSTSGTISVDAAVTHGADKPADCAAMVKAWNTGGAFTINANNFVTEPMGGLFGGASLIRTSTGTDYTYDPVPLDAWSNTPNHTEPGSLLPSLANVAPKTSVVFYNGTAVTDTWNGGLAIDPVSAVLMRTSVMNEYTVESIVNAGTAWVVTFPTKRAYVGTDSTSATDADTDQLYFERPFSDDFYTGGACEQVYIRHFDRDEHTPIGELDFSPAPPSGKNSLCWEVSLITFNGNNIMGTELAANHNVNVGTYQYGWMRLAFPGGNGNVLHTLDGVLQTGATDTEATRQLISDGNRTYHGLPVVGFMMEEFIRGDGSLDNYGGNFIHKYERQID